MKNLLYLSLIFIVFSCNSLNDKTEYFEKRYEEITLTPPEKLCLMFLERCNTEDANSTFSKYTPEMINRQNSAFFRLASEEHLKLVVDILIYKEVLKNKKKSIEDLQQYIDKINKSESDNLDRIVIKSFDFAVKYKAEQLRIESEYFDY
jgi:hypothetical protein